MVKRKIKFRIWDGEMFHYSGLIIPRNINGKGPNEYLLFEDYIYQQWTGLFDKKGREIYEGDIVLLQEGECDSSTKHLCEIFVKKTDHSPDFFHARPIPRDDKYRQFSLYRNTYEVVGSIFEYPDLLNDKAHLTSKEERK